MAASMKGTHEDKSTTANELNAFRVILGILAGATGVVLVIPAAMLLFPFWVVGTLAGVLQRFLEPAPFPWQELIEFYPHMGWKPRANASAHALDYGGDTYQFTTDADGWRGRETLDSSDVVVFGDSHAFGCGVDDRHFFADVLEGVRIKAIGAPAYSMVQPVLWMEQLAPHLQGKLVIWLVCLGNDLDDSMHPGLHQYRAPFARRRRGSDIWEIVTEHVDSTRWTITSREGSLDSLIEICSSGYTSERVFQAADYLVGRAHDVCASVGARLVVMTIPELSPVALRYLARVLATTEDRTRFDEELPDRMFARICDRRNVSFVALKDHLESPDYLENDFHWNPSGHRRVAELIGRLYRGESRDPTLEARSETVGGQHSRRSPVEAIVGGEASVRGGSAWD
jgi:hypothetical protein